MTTLFCEQCGARLNAVAKFCAGCGHAVGDAGTSAVAETGGAPRASAVVEVVEEVMADGKWAQVAVGATSVEIRRKWSPLLEIPFAEIRRIHSKLPGLTQGYIALETARGGRALSLGTELDLRHMRFVVLFGREASESIEAVTKAIEERTESLRRRGALPAPTWVDTAKAKLDAEKPRRKREIKVVEYKNRKVFEKNAKKMLADGWEITSTNLTSDRTDLGAAGAGGLLFGDLGFLAGLMGTKKGKFVVTCQRG